MKYEVRQLDCYMHDNEWVENTSYLMGEFITHCKAGNDKQAFTRYLTSKHGIVFKPNRTRIEFDGDCYTIIDRKTREPLFIAIPHY